MRRAGSDAADKQLERDYERLKPQILRTVRRKLAAGGVTFDEADLEGFYNQAWHAVYIKVATGEEIANSAGLLVSITHRRALDEHRALRPERRATAEELERRSVELDLPARLDDKALLRRLHEGMRDRLSRRELEAAALCYVHDYTRGAAAQVLGVRPKRMEKLMDGVAKKFSGLVRDIEGGDWCDSRRSLIKAYALGLLEAGGRRHELAVEHLRGCPACRRRVLALRGLAAVAPPVPALAAALEAGERASGVAAGLAELVTGDRSRTLVRVGAALALSAAAGSAGTLALDDDEPARGLPPTPALLEVEAAATPEPRRAPARRRPARRRRAQTASAPAPAATATPAPTPEPAVSGVPGSAARPAPAASGAPRPASMPAPGVSEAPGPAAMPAPAPAAPVVPASAPAEREPPPVRDGWPEFEAG